MNEAGVDALGFTDDLHAHAPCRHFLEQDAQLQLGEPRADAAVDAIAEGEVAPGILAVEFMAQTYTASALNPARTLQKFVTSTSSLRNPWTKLARTRSTSPAT